MRYKKLLIFAIVCFTVTAKVRCDTLSGLNKSSSETTIKKQTNGIKESADIELSSKDAEEQTAMPVDAETKPDSLIKSNKNLDVETYNPTTIETRTESLTETSGKQDAESLTESSGADSKSSPQVINVMQMSLNDEDKVMLQNLNGIIEKVPLEMKEAETNREGKSFKDEPLKRAAEALTEDEITEIVKSIAFPNEDEITEDSEALNNASETEVEPRSSEGVRMGKSLKSNHGYYVIAFTPIEEETRDDSVPYTRLQILPAERSLNADEPRLISKKTWNKYIRRLMRQIRKGTRKIQRKTKVKSLKGEPTVESFLKRMYKLTQEQQLKQQQQTKKKKSSWFIWR